MRGRAAAPAGTCRLRLSERRANALGVSGEHGLVGPIARVEPLLDALVDQHGPGRVVFRNARSVLKQFPERKLRPWKLDWPRGRELPQWRQLAKEFVSDAGREALDEYPYHFDARVRWLSDFLREVAPQKALVICRYKEKVVALQEALRRPSTASVAPAPCNVTSESSPTRCVSARAWKT